MLEDQNGSGPGGVGRVRLRAGLRLNRERTGAVEAGAVAPPAPPPEPRPPTGPPVRAPTASYVPETDRVRVTLGAAVEDLTPAEARGLINALMAAVNAHKLATKGRSA